MHNAYKKAFLSNFGFFKNFLLFDSYLSLTFQTGLDHTLLYHLYLPLSVASLAFLISLTIRFSLGLCIKAPVSTRQPNHMLLQLSRLAKRHLLNIIECVYARRDRQIKAIPPLLILQNNNQKNSTEIFSHTVY